MALVIECEDGEIDTNISIVENWSIKDLIQDNVLALPFKTSLVKHILDIQTDSSKINCTSQYLLEDLYRVIHFVGDSEILKMFRSLALKRRHTKFLLKYLEEWNIDEIKLMNLVDLKKSDNPNLTIILYYLIQQGRKYLEPLFSEYVKHKIHARPYPLWIWNQYRSYKTNNSKLHSLIRNELDIDYCVALQVYMNNELYLDRLDHFINYEKANYSDQPRYENICSLKDSTNDFVIHFHTAQKETLPLFITRLAQSIHVKREGVEMVLYAKKEGLFELTKHGENLSVYRTSWNNIFDYTTENNDKFTLGLDELIKVTTERVCTN